MIAVSAGREDVVAYLLDTGLSVDVNVVNSTGQNCLHYAASKNRLSVRSDSSVSLLRSTTYSSAPCAHLGFQLWCQSARYRPSQSIQTTRLGLLSDVAPVTIYIPKYSPPQVLQKHPYRTGYGGFGPFQIAKRLLLAGIRADLRDWGGNTPLHRAASLGHTDMIKLLLTGDALADVGSSRDISKCSPNTPNDAGQTPLQDPTPSSLNRI